MHRLLIACRLFGIGLRLEALELVDRVVEFVESVGNLFARHKELETFGDIGIVVTSSGERIDIDGVVGNEGWIDQLAFYEFVK